MWTKQEETSYLINVSLSISTITYFQNKSWQSSVLTDALKLHLSIRQIVNSKSTLMVAYNFESTIHYIEVMGVDHESTPKIMKNEKESFESKLVWYSGCRRQGYCRGFGSSTVIMLQPSLMLSFWSYHTYHFFLSLIFTTSFLFSISLFSHSQNWSWSAA